VTTTVQLVRTGQTTETFQSWSADNVTLSLTINGGTGPDTFTPGSTVTINATVPTGQRFVRWEVSGINLQASALTNPNMSFIIPTSQSTNIIALAIFEPISPQHSPLPTLPPSQQPTPSFYYSNSYREEVLRWLSSIRQPQSKQTIKKDTSHIL